MPRGPKGEKRPLVDMIDATLPKPRPRGPYKKQAA